MAVVYLAQDLKHDRKVAIKVLDPELSSVVGGERFLREIKIEANLQHPNILPLHDSGESDGFLYYVMPYVEGESLRDRLEREKHLPLQDALRIMKEVAGALSYAHDRGVIHRDVKPENIMLTGDHAVLADFGIARAIGAAGGEHVTETGRVVGTPAYMSPEQAGGESDLEGRSDTYSLACVLYEMLCGEPPFSGRTAQALIAKHMLEPAPSIETLCPSVPRHVAKAIERGLAKTRAERFTTSEFVAALGKSDKGDGWIALFWELGARRFWHLGAIYLALGWLAMELARRPIAERVLPDWVFFATFGLMAIGFPLMLALAWTQGKSRGKVRPSWLQHVRAGYFLAFLGTVVIGLLAVRASLSRLQPPAPIEAGSSLERTHIAVLPFQDLSEGQSLGHLCAGFTQVLIDELTQIEPLFVQSYNGVKQYRDSNLPLDSIARALRVGTIVGASVQESEGELRVMVELIDAATGTNLATATVAEPRTELFALQDDIVQEVSRFLREKLGIETRREEWLASTESLVAWELVLEAEELREGADDLRAAGDMEAAAQELHDADSQLARAESLDPSWIEPIVQRGWVATELARLGEASPGAYEQDFIISGLAHADRALLLAPNDAGALELRGVLLYYSWQATSTDQDAALRRQAEETLLRAVDADPSRALAWSTLSDVFRVSGLYGSALRAARNALQVDAFLQDANKVFFQVCESYWEMKDLEKAMPCFAEGRQRFPTDASFVAPELVYLASSIGPEPDVGEAWRLFEKLEELMGLQRFDGYKSSLLMTVAGALAREGLVDSANAVIRHVRTEYYEPGDPWPDYFQANVHLNLGEPDSALAFLSKFLEALPDRKAYVADDWWWRPLQDDPRFKALLVERPPPSH
jgi:serine/threonine-protein kinase